MVLIMLIDNPEVTVLDLNDIKLKDLIFQQEVL